MSDTNESNLSVRGNPRRTSRERNETGREPAREALRSGLEIEGRNGEVLTRRRGHSSGDPLYFDPAIIPPGWEYQWNTTDVFGNTGVVRDQTNLMWQNGWRPVPAERHPGVFMPKDYKGPVLANGCRLDERPKIMCEDAREEDQQKAMMQTQNRNDALMGNRAALRKAMVNGMEMDSRYRGTGGDLRMSIDPGLDVPRPKYDAPEPGQ
jgi:hypothetical protein